MTVYDEPTKDNGAGDKETADKPKVNPKARGAFATADEARAVPPGSDRYQLYCVTTPTGRVWTWARDPNDAILNCAKAAGYATTRPGKAPTREKVQAQLAQLSDEDRAVLIRQYVDAAATDKPAGRKAR